MTRDGNLRVGKRGLPPLLILEITTQPHTKSFKWENLRVRKMANPSS
jgi:hypothetical protein